MTETTIQAHECGECGVVFGLGVQFIKQRKTDRRTFYCPNGHGRIFTGKNEAEQLRDQLKYERTRANSWKDQAEAAERARRVQKGQLTKFKNRIKNGVCPCCNRTFQDLARHMAGQHPGYTNPTEDQ